MEEQYFLVRRLGLGRGVVCRSLVVTEVGYLTEVGSNFLSLPSHHSGMRW